MQIANPGNVDRYRIATAMLASAIAIAVLFMPQSEAPAQESQRFIVQETELSWDGPERFVEDHSGTVVADLGVIGGFVADMPANRAALLALSWD
ncbi:MAG: hypothetical protein P1T08_05485 [Acidimicrobiia bacterium]|nr:hypothetical protein [Acidimicrobiia bacterium]